jgi:LacI family transcriptional regulator
MKSILVTETIFQDFSTRAIRGPDGGSQLARESLQKGQDFLDRQTKRLYNPVSDTGNANDNVNRSHTAMPQRVTMVDVARQAGVSLMTVSRVVNNKEDVSPATRQRILEIIDELGYRPSGIARGLVTQRTGTIGLVVPDIDNPFFSGMVRGAENQAYAENYSVFLCNTNEDVEREIAVLQSLEDKQVDGLLLCSSRLDEEELRIVVARFPTVVLVSRRLDDDCVGAVFSDDETGSYQAVTHLIQSGHKDIGFISGPPVSLSGRLRLAGYRRAMDTAGIAFDPSRVEHCSPVVEGGLQASLNLLKRQPEITALLCHNDLVAVGALQACNALDRQVPDDVAVIGFDDIPLAEYVTPSLTTSRIPRYELGERAMRLLLDQIADHSGKTQTVVLPVELIVRESAP